MRRNIVWLALAVVSFALLCDRAVADNKIVNGDFTSNGAAFTNNNGVCGGSNPADIDNWGRSGAAGVNGGDTGWDSFGPANRSAATYYAFVRRGVTLTQTITLSPQSEYFIGYLTAARTAYGGSGRVTVGDGVTNFYDSGTNVFSESAFELVGAHFLTPPSFSGDVTIMLAEVSPSGDKTVCFSDVSIDPLLFLDTFSGSTSMSSPKGRATGSIRGAVTYSIPSGGTKDTEVNGTLNWDKNGDKNANNQHAANGTQNLVIPNNLAPYVAGKVWEVEFDQLGAANHPLTFGLSDDVQTGNWNGYSSTDYDYAAAAFSTSLKHDTDNDNGDNQLTVGSVFPSYGSQPYHWRIQFDEPNGTVTIWIDDVERGLFTTLDFENPGRYLSWGEPTDYAGYLDNIKISLILPEYVPPAGSVFIIR